MKRSNVGRLALCRVRNGIVKRGQQVAWCRINGEIERVKITELYMTQALDRVEIDRAHHKNTDGREAVANALRRTQRVLDALSEDDAEAWDGLRPEHPPGFLPHERRWPAARHARFSH